MASRKAVADHPLAIPFYAHLVLITTYSQLRQRAENLTEVGAIANFTHAVVFLILRRNSAKQISNVALRSKNNYVLNDA